MAKDRRSPINGVPLPEGQPFRQGEQQREIARRGGLKSQENRRHRKTLREDLLIILSTEVNGKTVQEGINNALIKAALNGNTKAFEIIRDTIGEKMPEKVSISNVDVGVIEEVEKLVNGK